MPNSSNKRPAAGGSSSSSSAHDRPERHPQPRLYSAVVKALEHNQLEKLSYAMEPMLRKVVSEEVERGLAMATTRISCRYLRRSPSFRVRALEPPRIINTSLHLVFPKTLKQPIYTKNKIVFEDNSPIQAFLVEPTVDPSIITTATVRSLMDLPFPMKLEIVALDGDFAPLRHDDDGALWSQEEFQGHVLRAREGKRPLLIGELVAALQPGGDRAEPVVAATFGEIKLTDNSRWMPSGKFRLGVRVIPGTYGGGIRIREAISEPFSVREHRGKYYCKHYPPKLEDDVWRLENIGKGGRTHKKLESEGIITVQDFLKMNTIQSERLLGIMDSKNLKASLDHAKTCSLGSKLYLFNASDGCQLVLDPICGLVNASINGQSLELASLVSKEYIDNLVKTAYANWNLLQEIDYSHFYLGS
ncbi:hypothetical protein SAY86_025003 [Trapa natans]|uniref:Uncharacterized protein n=1 Tax=Trapa natans TaxID=22666 RepID=A0AAN7RKB6_TRANT|nr:hypothetical protein SAY86_025003 [Trapa natans]